MQVAKGPRRAAIAISAFTAILAGGAVQAQEPACPYYENRSGNCGYYHSEISPARAFVDTVAKRGKWGNPQQQPVILDVRSLAEYKAGHPEHSYNVPFPYIHQYCDEQGRSPDGACIRGIATLPQDPNAFVQYVEQLIPDKNTPIYTLCRTGVRSVNAGNLLTDRGYTNVRNVWEGFVGVNLTAPRLQADGTRKVEPVDLNHDGVLDDQDKNGWRYHQDLPYDTRMLPHLVYWPYEHGYSWE